MTNETSNRGTASFFGRLAGAFALTMALSFVLVILLLNTGKAKRPDAKAIARAEQLRVFCNELVQATGEYLEKDRREEPNAEWERWLQRQYLPNVSDLRQRIVAGNLGGDAYLSLLQASDKVAAMGFEAKRKDLQPGTKQAVLDARDKIEAEIAKYGLGAYVVTQPATPSFRRDN